MKKDGLYLESDIKWILHPRHLGRWLGAHPIRPLRFDDFSAIIASAQEAAIANRDVPYTASDRLPVQRQPHHFGPGFADEPELTTAYDKLGRLIQYRDSRVILRNRLFREHVCAAYEFRCAFSRQKFEGPDGWCETEAAHLQPVSAGGPDSVQNGIALTASMHNLFDRHLITIDPEYRIRIVPFPPLLAQLAPRVIDGQRIHLPRDRELHPNPIYLAERQAEFERLRLDHHQWPRPKSRP